MKSWFVVVWIFSLPIVSLSQSKIDTIKSDDRPDELYFPLVRNSKPLVAQKINNYLQSNIVGNTTKKTPPGKLFDRRKHIMNDSVTRSGITFCHFVPVLNTQKLLSIQIDFEYMGAYPYSSSKYFNFNAQNGDPVIVRDLFTNTGLESLKKKINAERVKRINAYIADIKKNKTEDLIDDIDFIAETLQECLKYDTLQGFVIAKNKLAFNRSDCFPHAVMQYETNLDVELTIAEVSPWLNDFGKKALLTNSASIAKDVNPGIMKPFYGSIGGKYPIVLQFTDIYNDGSLTGFYYYESQGICIQLSGSIKGNSFQLEELDDKGTTANFIGIYDGKVFKGNWVHITKHASLPFTLKN